MLLKTRLEASLKACQKTYSDLARETGIDRNYIALFFRGGVPNPTVSTVTKLAQATGEKNPGWWCWRAQERMR